VDVGFDILLKMADRIRVAALWPRWGHTSDVPELLEMLLSYELIFLGPLAQPMDTLGDFNHQLRGSTRFICQANEVYLGSVLFHD
jgi:biotin carboxylase